MKSTIRLMWIIAMVALIGFSFAACGDPDGGEDADLTGTIIIDFDVEEEEDGSVPVGTELTAVYNGEEDVTYQWKMGTASVGNTKKITTSAAGNYTVTVSATGKNSKTSGSVTVWWVVDPKYAPYHGVWKWEGPKAPAARARDEFVTISFNKMTGDSTFKYHDTEDPDDNDSLTCSIDKWETKTKPATPTGYEDGFKLTCFMDEINGNPGFVPVVGTSFTYNVFLTTDKTKLVRSIPNEDTLAAESSGPRVYVKQ